MCYLQITIHFPLSTIQTFPPVFWLWMMNSKEKYKDKEVKPIIFLTDVR